MKSGHAEPDLILKNFHIQLDNNLFADIDRDDWHMILRFGFIFTFLWAKTPCHEDNKTGTQSFWTVILIGAEHCTHSTNTVAEQTQDALHPCERRQPITAPNSTHVTHNEPIRLQENQQQLSACAFKCSLHEPFNSVIISASSEACRANEVENCDSRDWSEPMIAEQRCHVVGSRVCVCIYKMIGILSTQPLTGSTHSPVSTVTNTHPVY